MKNSSELKTIDVGEDFYARLANRDDKQGDGKHNAVQFRLKYLSDLDSKEEWGKGLPPFICFDFANVRKIAPSFANEAFSYFTQYADPKEILSRITFKNITAVKMQIIEIELKTGFEELK